MNNPRTKISAFTCVYLRSSAVGIVYSTPIESGHDISPHRTVDLFLYHGGIVVALGCDVTPALVFSCVGLYGRTVATAVDPCL